ncbi:MAG: AMP-binding protein, partial [Gammaproteobacteria bacterium]|nr:AMP-binding protein [Gammaproteobacteria bacterium]
MSALIDWALAEYSPADLAAVVFSTSLSFDISVFELWAAWSCGGTVLIVDDILHVAEHALPAPTLINTVPSAAKALLDAGVFPPAVRVVNLAGEPLPVTLLERLLALRNIERVYNGYGPTEDTVYSTFARFVTSDGTAPHIGTPLPGTTAYVLDEHLELCPVGVPGELYLAGAGLARGYVGKPELTAERFIPDRYSAHPGGRVYRTGDIVELRSDGCLRFLGRSDQQVKIRGHRIEIGEVESRIARCAPVRDCAVVMCGDAGGELALAAFVVFQPQAVTADCAQALLAVLRAELPAYMIPAAVVPLAALPLTPNGKIDRKALRVPTALIAEPPESEAPEGVLEASLAGIFCQVLGQRSVGRHASFFESGGNSLSAMRLVGAMRRELGVEVPLRAIFEQPSVAQLASAVAAYRDRTVLAPLHRPERGATAPASFAQSRMWFMDRLHGQSSDYNMAAVFEIRGSLDVALLQQTFTVLCQRHEALRTVFDFVDDAVVQVIRPQPCDFDLLPMDLSGLASNEALSAASRMAQTHAAQPFDLKRGPLLRLQLIKLADGWHRLLFNVHHIVCDELSLRILCNELASLYSAGVHGAADGLEELAVQYAEHAWFERQQLQQGAFTPQLDYWRAQLRAAPEVHALPTDHPRQAVPSVRGGLYCVQLEAELVQMLQAACSRYDVTLFNVLVQRVRGGAGAHRPRVHPPSRPHHADGGQPAARHGRAADSQSDRPGLPLRDLHGRRARARRLGDGKPGEGFSQLLRGLDTDRFWGRFYKAPFLRRILGLLVEHVNSTRRDDAVARRRLAQAATEIASRNPTYNAGLGVLKPDNEQLRAIAWTLRDVMDAAYITPDGDPMKAYFEKLINDNLNYLVKTYVTDGATNAAGQLEGWIHDYGTSGGYPISPWTQFYFATVLGEAGERGYAQADVLLGWMENFLAGLFTSGELGFDPVHGTS